MKFMILNVRLTLIYVNRKEKEVEIEVERVHATCADKQQQGA